MLIPKRFSIIRLFSLGTISIVVLLSALHWGEWYFQRQSEFNKEVGILEEIHLTDQKKMIQREVTAAINFVRFQKQKLLSTSKQQLKERVYEAHKLATHLYHQYKDQKEEKEIFLLIKEALRSIRFNDGRGYFFVTNLNGTAELFPFQPQLEGKNLLSGSSSKGKEVAEQMINLIRHQQEGFVDYIWHKPGEGPSFFPKLAFIKHFAPADWYIGSGEYLDAFEREAKNSILDHINHIRFGQDGFIFALDYDSRTIAHAESKLIGNRMLDSKFSSIRAAFPEMLEASKNDGGFIEYSFRRPGEKKLSRKISYVAHVPEWEWIVGAGFFLDTFEQAINKREEELHHTIFSDSERMLLLSFIAIGFSALIARSISQKVQRNLSLFNDFFDQAASKSIRIDQQKVVFREFDRLAEAANNMIEQRMQSEEDRKQMEAQLLQSQKLEAIGTLAGGIAHDFNNLLASICGNLTLLAMKTPQEDERHKYLQRLDEATEKAKNLVAQILSFSRSSEGEKEIIDLAAGVKETLQLLRATIPSSVTIETSFDPGLYPVQVNRTQLHQVLMNLCSNAYQALPEQRGTICIKLAALTAPDDLQQETEAEYFAHLSISDTGCGIQPELLDKIFDPFFSTKEQGKGTGLGLAIAQRIIDSFGGMIQVESQLNAGTTFHIFLPLTDSGSIQEALAAEDSPVAGNGKILLVDDDAQVLESTADFLQQIGYQVAAFSDPAEALVYVVQNPETVDVLISDQTMPGMKGIELIDKIRQRRPDLPVFLCTGFSEQVDEYTAKKLKINQFMMKPVSLSKLSRALFEQLDNQ